MVRSSANLCQMSPISKDMSTAALPSIWIEDENWGKGKKKLRILCCYFFGFLDHIFPDCSIFSTSDKQTEQEGELRRMCAHMLLQMVMVDDDDDGDDDDGGDGDDGGNL